MKSTILDKIALCAGILLAPLATGAALPVHEQDTLAIYSASSVAGLAKSTPTVLTGGNSETASVPVIGGSKCWVSLFS
jgi:hypothetical protein